MHVLHLVRRWQQRDWVKLGARFRSRIVGTTCFRHCVEDTALATPSLNSSSGDELVVALVTISFDSEPDF